MPGECDNCFKRTHSQYKALFLGLADVATSSDVTVLAASTSSSVSTKHIQHAPTYSSANIYGISDTCRLAQGTELLCRHSNQSGYSGTACIQFVPRDIEAGIEPNKSTWNADMSRWDRGSAN